MNDVRIEIASDIRDGGIHYPTALPFNLEQTLEKLDNDIESTGGKKEWTPWRMEYSDEVGRYLNRIAEAVSK